MFRTFFKKLYFFLQDAISHKYIMSVRLLQIYDIPHFGFVSGDIWLK